MKKNKTAALLAAAFLMYGGAYSVQAETYFNNRIENNVGTVSYTDLAVDNKGTIVNIGAGSTINGTYGNLSTEGGTINMTDTAVTGTGLWANEKSGEAGGTITMTGGSVTGGDVYAQGNSTITLNGTTVTNVGTIGMTQTVIADNEQTMTGDSAGKVVLGNGANVTAGTIEATGTNGKLSVSGEGTSVTTGSLTMKPMEGNTTGSTVEVSGGTLTVSGSTELAGGALTVSGGAVNLGSAELNDGTVAVSGGALTANGTVSMTGSTMTVNGGSVHFAKDWTAAGGSTTVGNAGGASLMAEEDALTVDGTAELNKHNLTIESGNTVSQGALEATNGTEVTVNGTLNVTGNASLDGSTLTSAGATTAGSLTAGNQSTVSVDGSLTVHGAASLTDSTLTSSGATTLGSLTSTGNSKVTVQNGSFTADTVNTNQFYVNGGTVTLNGGTMTGDIGTNDNDGKSALYIDGEATVNATNVTFTGGEVAVDNGGELNLKGGTVDVPVDSFTTEGGTITTDGTTIKSGVWADKGGTVTLDDSTLTGGSIGAQGNGAITMNGGTADVDNVVLENGSTITFNKDSDGKGAVVTAGAITASGTGTNTLNIQGGSQVTADSLTATGSTISITGSGNADDSHLTINGDTVLSEGSKVTMDNAANATFNRTVDIKDATSGITFTGENTSATFASGSKLYANSTAPAVTVSDKATLTFAKGSSVYTTASDQKDSNEKILVNTVAQATGDGQITVDEGASLYITNLDSSSTYSLAQVVTGNTDTATNPDGWAGNAYGSSMLQVVDKDSGKVENRDFDTAYNGTVLAGAVYDAVIKGGQDSAAYKFTDAVIQGQAGASDASEIARISNALNSHSGMTGLAGAGYGTYRFTTAFTDAAANHEEGDLWASYLHDKSSVDGLSVGSLRADYDLTYDGAVIGSDFYRSGDTTIGAAFAYADGDISTKSGVYTKNDVDYYGGMIYGSMKGAAGMTYRAEIGYNRSSNDITQVNTGSRITGSVDADAFHVGVSAEKAIQTGTGVWTPFVGLQYIDLSLDDYSDSLGFRHEGDSAGLWNMPIGVNYKYEMANGSWTYAPTVTLGYRFAFGDDSLNETFSYNGVGSTFGTEIAEDSFFTRIGFEAKKDNLGFGVHYGYERGSNTEANQWGIDCSFYF